MSKCRSPRRNYILPAITVEKIRLNMFSRGYDIDQSLLAICYFCIGDTCPVGCSTTCFVRGTNVQTTKGNKKIEDIIPGKDLVISFNFKQNRQTVSTVRKVLVHSNVSGYLIINGTIRCTPEHRFWVNGNKWGRADSLKVGDRLMNPRKQYVPIRSISAKKQKVTVYNLNLLGRHHFYFAEQVLVHNWK